MTHTYSILAISWVPKDISIMIIFLYKKIRIFCGDPQKIVSLISKGASVFVCASLIKCPLSWDPATKLNWSINMKVTRNENNPHAISYAKFLLDAPENNLVIGITENANIIRIPNDLLINDDLHDTSSMKFINQDATYLRHNNM